MDVTSLPYCGGPPVPADLVWRWNADPVLILALVGLGFVARAAGARPLPLALGLGVLALLFISPLCALSSALFSMRVTHHVALTALAAPLIAASLPKGGARPWLWTALHAGTFWTWHSPAAYAFALGDDGAYWLMQVSLFGTALGLWRAIRNAGGPVAVGALLATMIQMGLLGALLTFAGTPLYGWHLATTAPWGLTALADQQLAGLVMWVPGSAIYLFVALRSAGDWLSRSSRPAPA